MLGERALQRQWDGTQKTTGGLLVWRKADNHTAFTNGHETWINGPNGLQRRLNSERFPWEADYAPDSGIATQEGVPAALLVAPAPSYVGLSNHIDPQPSGSSIRVDAEWLWLDGTTAMRISGDIPFSPNFVQRDGPGVHATKVSAYLCTPDKAGDVLQYNVVVSVRGDGIRYQGDWSPSHTHKHTVTCPKETPKPVATPKPDPTLPLAPAHRSVISSRAANWQGNLVEIVVAVQQLPNVSIGWTWGGGSGYTPFAVDGNTEYYHTYACTASEAGLYQIYWVRIASFGDGITYRLGEGQGNSHSISVTCPTAGETYTPQLAPTPTTPLPPVPSVSIESELIESAYNAWSYDRKVMKIIWDYTWPDGVAKIETSGIAGLTTVDGRPKADQEYRSLLAERRRPHGDVFGERAHLATASCTRPCGRTGVGAPV